MRRGPADAAPRSKLRDQLETGESSRVHVMDYGVSPYDEPYARPRRGTNYFAWTIAILLLTGFALAAWLGSFYIFDQPERPESYRILQRLHKIDQPKRFQLTAAPAGEFLTPTTAVRSLHRDGQHRVGQGQCRTGAQLYSKLPVGARLGALRGRQIHDRGDTGTRSSRCVYFGHGRPGERRG